LKSPLIQALLLD